MLGMQVGIDQGYSRCSIDVIVPIDKNSLLIFECFSNPVNGERHIFHEKGIVQFLEDRPEKAPGLFKGINIALDEKLRQEPADPKGLTQGEHFIFFGFRFIKPLHSELI